MCATATHVAHLQYRLWGSIIIHLLVEDAGMHMLACAPSGFCPTWIYEQTVSESVTCVRRFGRALRIYMNTFGDHGYI